MHTSRAPGALALLAFLLVSAPLPGDSVVVFNEIMYHPPEREAELEWVEFHNRLAVDVDLSGWSVTGGIELTFAEGTVIEGGGFLVVALSPAALEAELGVSGAVGPFTGRLDNAGELLELRDRNGRLMDRVRYRDRGAWPVAPDGSGVSLARKAPGRMEGAAAEWTRSARIGGTPGAPNTVAGPGAGAIARTVAFNETLVSAEEAWLEVINVSGGPVDLAGFVLVVTGAAGAGAAPAEVVLDGPSIGPGERAVLAGADVGLAAGGLAAGSKVFLYEPGRSALAGAVLLAGGLQGRHPEGTGPWLRPVRPTPGGENSFALHDEIVINEIMYHHRPTLEREPLFERSVLLPIDAAWRFEQSGRDLGTAWREPDFDDSGWESGAGLFFNETASLPAAKKTPIDLGPITHYFRTEFDLDGDPAAADLILRHVIDDGAVFYLNGVEVHRFQMPDGDITASTLASRSTGNAAFRGPFTLPRGALAAGRNVLAVEVHQVSDSSNDVVFGAELVRSDTVLPAVEYSPSPEEWVELLNRSDHDVDIGGWRFDNGIAYTFEEGTVMAPGEHLVLAADRESLQARYPAVRIVGDFEGRLSNRTDRLELVDAAGNPADEVRYHDRGHWPRFADGLGSSLERRDPRADGSKASSWAASDESGASTWQRYRYRAVAEKDFGPAAWNEFVFGLLQAGEVLVDDISVIESPGTPGARELLRNGDFEAGAASWRFLGTHELSEVIADPDDPAGGRVLHLVATGPTGHMHNHVETTLVPGTRITNGREYEVSFRARWLAGSRQLHTRLYFNRVVRTNILEAPDRSGTPGAPNSRLEENIGPTYDGFGHAPIFPAAGEGVTVSVRAADPDGVAACRLFWSRDRSTWQSAPMTRRGGDAGDPSAGALYEGVIPWQGSGVVTFYVEGEDTRGATSTFPPDGPGGGAVFKDADGAARGQRVHTLRVLMAPDLASLLYANTHVMSNAPLPATVILDEERVFYDAGVRLKGSERGRPGGRSLHIKFQPDEPFLGAHRSVSIDRSGGHSSLVQSGAQDEILIKHMAQHAGGIPSMYDDIVHVIAPRSSLSGKGLLMMARYTDVYLDSQFENGSDGTLFTYELIYYPTRTVDGDPQSLKRPQPDNVIGLDHGNLGVEKESYRWFYLIENNRQRDDYSDIMRFSRSLGLSGRSLEEATRESMDIDQFLRVFAFYSLCGVGDTYMSGLEHNNMYYVRPSDRRVLVFPWDMDFAFFNSASHPVVWSQHNLKKVLLAPANTRGYFRHILDIIETTFNRGYMSRWVSHYGALDGIDFGGVLGYIDQRKRFVERAIPAEVPFAITTNGGEDFAVEEDTGSVAIEGTAWIDAATLLLAERPEQEISWPTVTRWRTRAALEPGENELTFLAFDEAGEIREARSITVTRPGPPAGEVFIRGDANLDGAVNISDAVSILFHLFGGVPITCEDAGDIDDDERLDVTDAVRLLGFLFLQGAPPPAPFPAPGPDPGGDGLGCAAGLR